MAVTESSEAYKNYEDDKYIVFKLEDWNSHIKRRLGEHADDIKRLYRVKDAVVLRGQDIFAQATFAQHASSILSVMDFLTSLGLDEELPEVMADLQRQADHFMFLTEWSADLTVGIPD